jgi:carbon storage regulator
MLVLAFKEGEEAMIGDNVRLKLVEMARGRACIGFDAPLSVRILRWKIYERVLAQRAQALELAHGGPP